MSLKDWIENKITNSHWLLNIDESVIVTRDLLAEFGISEDEHCFVAKLQRLRLPVETLGRLDRRLENFDHILKEMREKPGKKQWYLMKSKNFKRALLLLGTTRVQNDLKKYYTDLEDCVRDYVIKEKKIKRDKDLVDNAVKEAMVKFAEIMDQKILQRLGS